MGKQPTSTTQNTFPPWLMKALQPLMGGASLRPGWPTPSSCRYGEDQQGGKDEQD